MALWVQPLLNPGDVLALSRRRAVALPARRGCGLGRSLGLDQRGGSSEPPAALQSFRVVAALTSVSFTLLMGPDAAGCAGGWWPAGLADPLVIELLSAVAALVRRC